MRSLNSALSSPSVFFLLAAAGSNSIAAAQVGYEIISLGQIGESVSGGQALSSDGTFGTGFSDTQPFLWESGVGVSPLMSEASRPFSTPWDVNDAGVIVGIGALTFFGSSPLPILWQGGTATTLALPAGQTLGRAYGLNDAGLIVGSVNGGSLERAAVFSATAAGSVLTQTLAGGALTTAYGVNESGRVVGQATDPTNVAVTKGFYLDPGDTAASDLGALTSIGHNSAIPFDVSDAGFVTGSSSFNSGVNARAFFWSEAGGMVEVPLPTGTTTASGRGVNDDRWVVGTAASATSIPFLFDGTDTFRLQDVIEVGGAGWDLVSGTSNGAFGIANDGSITGRGLLNGQLTAFVMRKLGGLGDFVCAGEPNSTGAGARLSLGGSAAVADMNLTITMSGLPLNSMGYVLTSRETNFAANPGGSSGNLCIASATIGRFAGNVLNSGATGTASFSPNLSAFPSPTGIESVMMGETRFFQHWYRDSSGGTATSNFSDALGLTFQ